MKYFSEIFHFLSVSFFFYSFPPGVWVGILNLIVSIPGLSVLTFYLMKIHELKIMSAMMGEQTVKASLKISSKYDAIKSLLIQQTKSQFTQCFILSTSIN